MMIVKSGDPPGDGPDRGPGENGPSGYPDTEEHGQRVAEETLLHLLYEERFRESRMAVRNLDSRSRDYLYRLAPILEGRGDSRPVHKRVLTHANRSMQFQDGMLLYVKRRNRMLQEGSRQREILSEIASVLMACRHRNDLLRRLLIASLGRIFSQERTITT
jgi:hypothetical protein